MVASVLSSSSFVPQSVHFACQHEHIRRARPSAVSCKPATITLRQKEWAKHRRLCKERGQARKLVRLGKAAQLLEHHHSAMSSSSTSADTSHCHCGRWVCSDSHRRAHMQQLRRVPQDPIRTKAVYSVNGAGHHRQGNFHTSSTYAA